MRRWQPAIVVLALLLRVTTARRRGALRPHAKALTRMGRTVYYEVVKSKPRQPGDRHNQGGVRGSPILRNSTWMEVAHTRDARDLLGRESASLWMYRAREGRTRVWYETGPTLASSPGVQ